MVRAAQLLVIPPNLAPALLFRVCPKEHRYHSCVVVSIVSRRAGRTFSHSACGVWHWSTAHPHSARTDGCGVRPWLGVSCPSPAPSCGSAAREMSTLGRAPPGPAALPGWARTSPARRRPVGGRPRPGRCCWQDDGTRARSRAQGCQRRRPSPSSSIRRAAAAPCGVGSFLLAIGKARPGTAFRRHWWSYRGSGRRSAPASDRSAGGLGRGCGHDGGR